MAELNKVKFSRDYINERRRKRNGEGEKKSNVELIKELNKILEEMEEYFMTSASVLYDYTFDKVYNANAAPFDKFFNDLDNNGYYYALVYIRPTSKFRLLVQLTENFDPVYHKYMLRTNTKK
jgi:hypothetical protein